MRNPFTLPGLVFLTFFLIGCQTYKSYFLVGTPGEKKILKELFIQLEEEEGVARFTLVRQISDILRKTGHNEKQILFLTQYVEEYPGDPYNSFYLALVAEAYERLGAISFAMHYHERILKNYPDLIVGGSSIHFNSLSRLINHETNKEYLIQYYKEMISQFERYIDVGVYYYYLAEAYEDVGSWDLSIQAYRRYLFYPEARIPGIPDAAVDIKLKVAFYESSKTWTVPDLQLLVSEIKTALKRRDGKKLNQYKAKVNFFAKYWKQKEYHAGRASFFNINSWLVKSSVSYKNELESYSNPREAFLKTWNWQYYKVNTWYFYFRKVDFPADPEINGRWEWAGIYFGDKG